MEAEAEVIETAAEAEVEFEATDKPRVEHNERQECWCLLERERYRVLEFGLIEFQLPMLEQGLAKKALWMPKCRRFVQQQIE